VVIVLIFYINLIKYKDKINKQSFLPSSKNNMKKIVIFGKKKFICELKKVAVRGGKKTAEKVFCKEIKNK